MRAEPRDILFIKFQTWNIFDHWARHHVQAAFGLINFYLLNVKFYFFRFTSPTDSNENKNMVAYDVWFMVSVT